MTKKLILSGLALSFLLSCSRNDNEMGDKEYTPVIASGRATDFKLSIVDVKGNDLLTDKNFVNTISATGNLSKKAQTFSTIRWDKEGGFNFVEVYPDLPDEKKMNPIITPTTKQSFGSSTLTLNIGNTITKLDCDFKYSNSGTDTPDVLGLTGIYLTKVKLNNTEQIDFKTLDKRLLLIYDNGTISVKK